MFEQESRDFPLKEFLSDFSLNKLKSDFSLTELLKDLSLKELLRDRLLKELFRLVAGSSKYKISSVAPSMEAISKGVIPL